MGISLSAFCTFGLITSTDLMVTCCVFEGGSENPPDITQSPAKMPEILLQFC